MATAGKKPLTASENRLPDLVADAGTQMLQTVSTVNDIEKEEMLAAGIELGRLEAMTFITTIGESASVAIYENVKKSKAWKIAKHSDGRNFDSLDDFCRVKLGKSYNRLQELASNRKLIGQEAFEQAERLGLRQVDYNAIKGLPAPEQELIRRAVEEASTRDDVLGVLQELAARHAKEREQLTAQVEEAAADLEAKDRVLADKAELIQKLEEQTARKFKPRAGSEAKTLDEQNLLDELDKATMEANITLRKLFLAADTAMSGTHRESIQERASQAVQYTAQLLAEISIEFGIAVNFEEMVKPAWLDEAALDAMEARQRAQAGGKKA